MQIYATDLSQHLIHVQQAVRSTNYICPICTQTVRPRGGNLRQLHFFHFDSIPCKLTVRSKMHLHIQYALQQRLGHQNVQIEKSFSQIARRADLVWTEQKIVFEIQISPISAQEVLSRSQDYQKMGYTVVWILHKKSFNRYHLSEAEIALRAAPHYFTNMDSRGKGIFYDQYSLTRFKRRIKRTPILPVNFKQIFLVDSKQLARHFPEERKRWPISFEGDLFQHPYLIHDLQESSSNSYWKNAVNFCRAIFNYLLEKTTY